MPRLLWGVRRGVVSFAGAAALGSMQLGLGLVCRCIFISAVEPRTAPSLGVRDRRSIALPIQANAKPFEGKLGSSEVVVIVSVFAIAIAIAIFVIFAIFIPSKSCPHSLHTR